MSTHVLLVDDEPLIVHNLKVFLEDEGMEVESAGSAEEAIARVQQGVACDVCIMDMRLPGMDGNVAIQCLHALRPAVRFIIHTGSTGYTLPEELRALGIKEIQLFRKPVADMRTLAEMVRTLAGT
jgi:DNA-binding NtrC family response regulator